MAKLRVQIPALEDLLFDGKTPNKVRIKSVAIVNDHIGSVLELEVYGIDVPDCEEVIGVVERKQKAVYNLHFQKES